MALKDCIKQKEITRMDDLIEDFINAPEYETELSIDLRNTVLNGRDVVLKFVIEEI